MYEKKLYNEQLDAKVEQFSDLVAQGDNGEIRSMLMQETDKEAAARYQAILLEYIKEQSALYIDSYQTDDAELSTIKSNLDELRDIMDELIGLFSAFDEYEKLQLSDDFYAAGIEYYSQNDILSAKDALMSVNADDKNYGNALKILGDIKEYEDFWESRIGSGLYGRKSTGLTEQDGYIYFDYTKDNVSMIVKYNPKLKETQAFPLFEIKGDYIIKSINAVGDYLFFIAGENVGKGYVIDNPYNIYRMKNDGTGLTLMAQGDYFDLICFEDVFYALSYTEGLVEFDKFFGERTIIKKEDIVSIHPCAEGVYYLQRKSNEFLSEDTLYLYDGKHHMEIFSGENLRCYFYDDEILYTHYGFDNRERFKITTDMFTTSKQLFFINVRTFFGRIENKIYFLTTDSKYDEYDDCYDFESWQIPEEAVRADVSEYKIIGIYEDSDKLLLSKNKNVYLSDTTMENPYRIRIPQTDKALLEQNQEKLSMYICDEWYSDEETVSYLQDYWHYRDDSLYITIEKDFSTTYDTTIYVAHIRTTGKDQLSIGHVAETTEEKRAFATSIAAINHAVLAVNGDFWNEADNRWTGIIIRDGVVYKEKLSEDMIALNPDGTFSCYTRETNPITVEELEAAKIQNTLSFGPELLDDGVYGNVDDHFLARVNPRTAIGMVEPNHFVVICCDGRSIRSKGLKLRALADIFSELGCTEAYNLDGGQSMSLVFMGELLNDHSDDRGDSSLRRMPEIVYIGESDLVQHEQDDIKRLKPTEQADNK
jgi:exopolysaccharide biosynthesis protein